jgi:hypothetical protein
VYSDPETHAANPPSTWAVVKRTERSWVIVDQEGTVLERAETKRQAVEMLESGILRRLYDSETRWYAGETPAGWKSWAECKAERDRITARWALRAPLNMTGATQASLFEVA